MNMLNRNCKMSFVKPEFFMKALRANPRLYDIGCYNDNLALMLAPESDETKNKSLESSNNHFKEANNDLSKTNQLMFKDLKKFQAEVDWYHDVNYASK
ncbi:hypothetical protein Tco_0440660 [Tanacetum coccineum]